MNKIIKRGEIFWVKFDPAIGSEINKTRPALIVSNDAGNLASNRVIVAPITSSVIKIYPFEVKVMIKGKQCKILLNQIRTVDKIRVNNKIITLEPELMIEVDKALKIALSLS